MPRLGRTRPASDYKTVRPVSQIALGAHGLTTPNLQLAAPSPSVSAGATVSLTTPNEALAAPLLAPGQGPSLTTPNLSLSALLMQPYQAIALSPVPLIPMPIAGFGYQQADFIELWSNPAAFFQQRVVFRATQATTPTTIPSSGAVTTIVFDNIIEDPYSGWSAFTANQWSAPVGGYYQVTVTVWMQAAAASNIALQVYVQTGKSPANIMQGLALSSTPLSTSGACSCESTWVVYLAAGDSAYAAAAIRNAGANINTQTAAANGQVSSMEIIWLSS